LHEEKLAGVTGLRVSPRLPSRTCFGIFFIENKNIDKVEGGVKLTTLLKEL